MPPKGFREIAIRIAGLIALGEYPSGTKLPTTEELAEEYECGERTIVDAMRLLGDRGLIRSVRGGRRYVK